MEGTDPNVIPKQRHGCLTAWLVFMIVIGAFYLVAGLMGDFLTNLASQSDPNMAEQMAALQTGPIKTIGTISTILYALVIVVAVFLFQWKKWAFWAYSGIIGVLVVLTFLSSKYTAEIFESMEGMEDAAGIMSMASGIGMIFSIVWLAVLLGGLYGVLQIKQGGLSGWQNLE